MTPFLFGNFCLEGSDVFAFYLGIFLSEKKQFF